MIGQTLSFSDPAAGLCTIFILLIPFAAAGLSLIYAGLARTRAVAHSLFTSLCAMALAAVSYFAFGFAWQGTLGSPSAVLTIGGKHWDWIATGPFFLRGASSYDASTLLIVLFGMLTAGVAALIPLGSGTERWRIAASFASSAILTGWTFPLFAHWVWGGGWLQQLGTNYGLGQGFVDTAGSGCIQAVGGLTALPVIWILGARRGKYNSGGMPTATPGHNAPYVVFGCILALVGWFGLNSAGALLFSPTHPVKPALVLINTLLAACGGVLSVVFLTRVRFGKPDASLCANGWVGGLVASSAGCTIINPAEALLIGLISGTLILYAIELLELRMKVDDPSGAIAVHAIGGLWGLLAVGLFTSTGQLVAQLVGIATLLGFIFPMTYLLNLLLNRFVPFRVTPEGERQGLDLHELGAGAYPEFMIHRDDLNFR